LDSLLARAAGHGYGALALTDEGNLHGAVPFFEKAREAGLRPILGSLLDAPDGQAVVLVETAAGYANLCELITRRNLHQGFRLAAELPTRQTGLVVLTPSAALAGKLAGNLDRGRLWLELLRPAVSLKAEEEVLEAARRLDLGLVASCDVFLAAPEDFELHRALTAMHRNCLLAEVGVEERRSGFLRGPEAMARLFADRPGALRNSLELADRCRFDLLAREPVFPKLPGDSAARLEAEALAGAHARYGRPSAAARERLDRELALIRRMGFADYFLVVADIVRYARGLGTPVAGRGSGASSLAAYCLGITNVDPLAYGLPFERFLNEGRQDYPDLDIDFCWRLRDEVIAHVYRRHGADHVAMIATYATLQPRLALREAGKVLGLSNAVITRVEKRLRLGAERQDWGSLPAESVTVEQALELARRLEGFPHHLSVHCGGVVITPDAIRRHAPLQRAEKGVVITQYDKDAVEAVGLVKLDLLGNRALSSAGEAFGLLRGRGSAASGPEDLPDGDPATAALLARGDTLGVNQLESPAMRHLVRQLRPGDIRGLMQALALIRPGAASLGMKESFVRRIRGLEPVPALDPRLDSILGATRGVLLYEDDVLLVAAALGGLSLPEADRFRRAVTKCRTDDERLRLSRDFLGRCRAAGAAPGLSADLWVQMAKFNAYSFCRAHAASYARLAWANAWLKAHHPAEFWIGALNNNASMYPHWVYLEEARRSGARPLLPCVNRSGREFALEDGAIRTGLGRIRGISERTVESILADRPFEDLRELLARSAVRPGEAEALIRCGALDFTGRPRPVLILELHTGLGRARKLPGVGRLLDQGCDPAAAALPGDYPLARKAADEWELLELWSRAHPLAALRPDLTAGGAVASGMLPGLIGRRVRLAGMAAAGRRTRAEGGRMMAFLTLSDEEGLVEATMFPDVYGRSRRILADGGLGPFVVEGVVESQYDALSITAQRVASLQGEVRWARSA